MVEGEVEGEAVRPPKPHASPPFIGDGDDATELATS